MYFDRLIYTLRLEAFEALSICFGIFLVTKNAHAPQPSDPEHKKAEPPVQIARKALQNSIEQLLLSVISKLVLSTYLTQDSMKLIPLLVFLFVFGRVTFVIGYFSFPTTRRAYGFAMSFLPNLVTLLCCIFFAFYKGPAYGLGN